MSKAFIFCALNFIGLFAYAQEKVGDKWFDNNLSIMVVEDEIKTKGILEYCVVDTSQSLCVENLTTGVEVKVFNGSDEMIWMGVGSGRLKKLALSKAFPDASYITIKAFKPFVTNKSSGTRIYQDEPIKIKYLIK